jgi:hypothetical protein
MYGRTCTIVPCVHVCMHLRAEARFEKDRTQAAFPPSPVSWRLAVRKSCCSVVSRTLVERCGGSSLPPLGATCRTYKGNYPDIHFFLDSTRIFACAFRLRGRRAAASPMRLPCAMVDTFQPCWADVPGSLCFAVSSFWESTFFIFSCAEVSSDCRRRSRQGFVLILYNCIVGKRRFLMATTRTLFQSLLARRKRFHTAVMIVF